MYEFFLMVLELYFWVKLFNIVEENIQVWIRGMLLMVFFNKFGNIVLNILNKSEMVVGYGILYGDMCGGLFVIGDVYKMEVFELVWFMNKDGEVIFENIIIKFFSVEFWFD